MENKMWLCKDGRLLSISEMSDSHLHNSIELIRRRNGWRMDYLPRMELEQQIRAMGLNSRRARDD